MSISFKIKNNKLFDLIEHKWAPKYPECKVPIIYLSSHQFTDTEYRQLKFDLSITFLNKKRDVKKDVATNMESLAYTASKNVKNI